MKKPITYEFEHDGYTFVINMRNYRNIKYDIIGFYYDRMGFLQTIHRDSIYGGHARREIG
jgi:hypothetical protein